MTRINLGDLPPQHVKIARERYAAAVGTAAPPADVPKRRKYGNKRPTSDDGFKFDSMLEMHEYYDLRLRWQAGEVSWFTRQVPFQLAPNSTYVADFLVVYADRRVEIIDTKGADTADSKTKRKVCEHLYGFKIRVLKRHEVRAP